MGALAYGNSTRCLNFVASHAYGPYAGWSPVALTILGNNTYLLWRYTDGSALLWVLDANLNYITSRNLGSVGGWVPEGLGNDPFGNIRLVWKTPANQIAVWVLNSALSIVGSSPTYGPYLGYNF